MVALFKQWLRVVFDVETSRAGWDVRAWPVGRLYYREKPTTGGVEKRVGVYRFGRGEWAVEWWKGL